jgi:hypothetical protein
MQHLSQSGGCIRSIAGYCSSASNIFHKVVVVSGQ